MGNFAENALRLTSCGLLVHAWLNVRSIIPLTRNTSATHAINWAQAACFTIFVSGALHLTWLSVPPRITSAVDYLAAIMLLTPLIAILGARRPGASAWPWFVVLPMIVVLQWPSFSQLASGQMATAIEIPTPTLVGFFFVLVMGAGNYFGTELTGAVFAGSLGVVAAVLPSSVWTEANNIWFALTTTILICVSAHSVGSTARQRDELINRTQGDEQLLWRTFRDIFGIVWAKRVMDRVNQFADRERWNVRLSLDGFETNTTPQSAEIPVSEQVPARATHVLCWVLRRFLDRDYLLRFVPAQMTGSLNEGVGETT